MRSNIPACLELKNKVPLDWKVVPLEEVTDFQEGPGILAKDFHEEGIPLLRLRNIETPQVKIVGCNYLSPEKFQKKWKHFSLKEGDFLISTSASLGRVSVVGPEAVGSVAYTGIIRFRSKSTDLHQKYLRAFLSSKNFVEQAESMATGSVIKHFGPSHLKQMAIALPRLDQQEKIAELFDLLDSRIILLCETNATLEAMAQALFKSWFVDFDPVHAKQQGRAPEGMDAAAAALFPDSFEESELGMVPKGWKVKPIGDLAPTVGGATPDTKNEGFWSPAEFHWSSPKDLSGATSPVLLATEKKVSAAGLKKISSGLLPEGTLLMSSRAPIGYLAISAVPVAINQGYIAIPTGGALSPLYMLFWCKANMEAIKGNANGSTFMEISKKAFRPILAIEPEQKILNAFEDVAGAFFQKLKSNEEQAQALSILRDTLLPRLVSGQLRLPEADALAEQAIAP